MKTNKLKTSISEIFGVRIELHSNTEAIVDGIGNVTDYFDDRIKFNIGRGSVTFVGKNLAIVSFLDSSAIIKGEISSVEFGG